MDEETKVTRFGAVPPALSTLIMNQLIDVGGDYPQQGGTSPPVNTMAMVHSFAGNFGAFGAPNANGAIYQDDGNEALASILGGAYGSGGSEATLPNLNGLVAVGGGPGQPAPAQSLAMTYLIAAIPGSIWPVPGAIALFAGGYAPTGWLAADGSLLPIAQHNALFGVIGTNFGGDGATSFALPNLGGSAAIGTGGGPGPAPIGLGQAIPAGQNGGIPALGLNYMICIAGVMPDRAGYGGFPDNDPYVGQVIPFAGATIPDGWALAQGQLLQIASNTALYSVIGITYGGDGHDTFALPDLRGRMIAGLPK